MPGIVPVVMCGGAGTRLLPLSTPDKPKQFHNFGAAFSLFQATLLRCRGGPFSERPIVVAAQRHAALVNQQLSDIGCDAQVILEPAPRNSCAAALIGTALAFRQNKDAAVAVLAADHHIADVQGFRQSFTDAADSRDHIVTFGVKPRYPATSYGYIEPGDPLQPTRLFLVRKFVEKPVRDEALSHIKSGYVWNSGNVYSRAAIVLAEADVHCPAVASAMTRALDAAKSGDSAIQPDPGAYDECPNISLDRAILEKTRLAAVLKVAFDWSDVGTWEEASRVFGIVRPLR